MIQNFTYTERAYIALTTARHMMNIHGLFYAPVAHRLLCRYHTAWWQDWVYNDVTLMRNSIREAIRDARDNSSAAALFNRLGMEV